MRIMGQNELAGLSDKVYTQDFLVKGFDKGSERDLLACKLGDF